MRKFSILIPAYKSKYLKECIESILNQSYTYFEVIVVDDCSPENISEIVSTFKDERIIYKRNERNCGAVNVVDNWNKCLNLVTGDYVICMGDDDVLLSNCLADYNSLINEHPGLNVYHAFTQVIDEYSNIIRNQESRPSVEGVYSMIWHRWRGGRIQFIGDYLFRTSFLKQNEGFYKLPLAWGSDEMTGYLAAIEGGIANASHPMFQYRQSRITITSSGNSYYKLLALFENKAWFVEFLKEEPSKDNSIEYVYWEMLKNDLDKYFEERFANNFCFKWTVITGLYKYNQSHLARQGCLFPSFFSFVKLIRYFIFLKSRAIKNHII